MTAPLLRRLSPPAFCAAVALVGGLLGGTTTVYGLRPNQYGPIGPPVLVSRSTEGGYAETDHDDGGSAGSSGCYDCSERDLGYRWATLQDIHSPAECPNDSWGFRRGCIEYTGGV